MGNKLEHQPQTETEEKPLVRLNDYAEITIGGVVYRVKSVFSDKGQMGDLLDLAAIEKRLAELGKLVQAIYEDKVMGRIPEAVCVQLMNQYEAERAEKLEQKGRLSGELEAYQQETDDVQQWIRLIQEYAKLEELDRPTLLRLINRIDIGEKKVEDGHTVRDVKIHYNFVGYIEA